MALLDVVIDVSDAQHAVDWAKVAAAGVKVAMIKATEGATFKAASWDANRSGAQAAQIRIIPYHFVIDAEPAAQAAHFEAVAGLQPGMPYALDWEPRVLRDGTDITASAAQVEAVGQMLAAIVGRNPLGYWGLSGNTPEAPTAVMNAWERWVPRYRIGKIASFDDMPATHQSPAVGIPFLFWQYTDGGDVDGIDTDVDRSVANFASIEELLAWCAARAAGPVAAAASAGPRPA
jgi:GH25 family lysozyme M1 (1,4-beta-N-acetylmuramidase)